MCIVRLGAEIMSGKSNIVSNVLSSLNHKIDKVFNERYKRNILNDDSYFTRKGRKTSFKDTMKTVISFGSDSLTLEMNRYFNDKDTLPITQSGFIQSRAKIKTEAFIQVMNLINKAYPCKKKYKGYRLLAVDGSDLSIAKDKKDDVSKKFNGENVMPSYMLHINCEYDILNDRYVDCVIQKYKEMDENAAFVAMLDRYKGDKAIFIADRNYATYNNMAHLKEHGHTYLIRSKDINTKTSILKNYFKGKEGEFDEDVSIILTRKQTNFIKENKDKYKTMMPNQIFDYLDLDNHFYEMKFRVVRIRIDGNKEEYESVITNLEKDEFSKEEIKDLYMRRWNIEVSYRHLKYVTDLNRTHSVKRDFLIQEIWAKLIMFNISMIMINYINENKISKEVKRKDEYKVNVSVAVELIRSCIKRKGHVPPGLIKQIASNILPVRHSRKYNRNVHPQRFVSFNYR